MSQDDNTAKQQHLIDDSFSTVRPAYDTDVDKTELDRINQDIVNTATTRSERAIQQLRNEELTDD